MQHGKDTQLAGRHGVRRSGTVTSRSVVRVQEYMMNVDADNLSQQVHKSETDEDAGAASAGFVFAGLARASILWFKKSMIMIPIKKQAFLQIGRLTHTTGSSVANTGTTTTTDKVTSGSKPLFLHKGLTKELAKSAVLGITVFGTYEYLVQHYSMKVVNDNTNAQSTVLVHMGAGACAGLVQSSVLTTLEVTSKLTSHHGIIPHNWRGSFLARRAVHHAIGYACLFGTFEATRRVLLYYMHLVVPLEETHPRASTSLATTFLAGGIAGQVHHFVNYVTSHWKLQLSTSDLRKHAQLYTRYPNRRANLAAFGPTALCFVAFHFGEELTEQMRDV